MKRSIAIVGAGVCGSICASRLRALGHSVNVFDKGRGPGGRSSSRRGESGHRFDHGASRLDVTRPLLHDMLAAAVAARVLRRDGDTYTSPTGLSALCKWLLDDVPARYANKWIGLERTTAWMASDEAGVRHGPFDGVVLAIPPANAVEIMQAYAPGFARTISGVRMMPRWVTMLGFAAKQEALPDRATIDGHAFRRSMSNSMGDAFVIEASADWSTEHVERDAGDVAERLLEIAKPLLGTASPTSLAAHRWRYAFADRPLGVPFLQDGLGLYVCGDWCVGHSIEAAWESATAVVAAIAAT